MCTVKNILFYCSYCRCLVMMSSLMLLTQRVTSVSMDVEDGKVILPPGIKERLHISNLLPFICYNLSFTSMLGGPLCSYNHFLSFLLQIQQHPPPSPLSRVFLRLSWVAAIEGFKCILMFILQISSANLNYFHSLQGALWMWNLSLFLKMSYYSHWAVSECLNNAIGLGYRGNLQDGSSKSWNGLSDGELWTTETSCRLSEFTRRWNGTTAAWLRRLVYQRCKAWPLVLTFGFSALWHGLYPGQVAGFALWAASVKADRHIHRYLKPRVTSPWRRKTLTSLSWIQTQMTIACVVIAIEVWHASLWFYCIRCLCIFLLIHVFTVSALLLH